ncbi:hypothetical protein FKM82_014507 [Ascaphus truei]
MQNCMYRYVKSDRLSPPSPLKTPSCLRPEKGKGDKNLFLPNRFPVFCTIPKARIEREGVPAQTAGCLLFLSPGCDVSVPHWAVFYCFPLLCKGSFVFLLPNVLSSRSGGGEKPEKGLLNT